MEFTVFKKKVTPKNGNKPFTKYVTTLTNKVTGEKVYCDVHFPDDVAKPSKFPCVLTVDKANANLSHKTFHKGEVREDGTSAEYTVNNLWVNAFTESEYTDTSLDEF